MRWQPMTPRLELVSRNDIAKVFEVIVYGGMKEGTPKTGRGGTPEAPDPNGLVADYLADRVKRWLESDLRRSRSGLARTAGLRAEQVHDLLDRAGRPTLRSMRAVARAVGIAFDDLEEAAHEWISTRDGITANRAQGKLRPSVPRADSPSTDSPASRLRSDERYPNRVRAVQAAVLLQHDPADIQAVREVVLPPGTDDPTPRAWMSWIEKAREERTRKAGAARAHRSRRTP